MTSAVGPVETTGKKIVMVAAVADNGVIGLDDNIPWKIPEDLAHFRAVTRGNTVIMGRRTFEGIGHPLPYRSNVVMTRDPDWSADGVFVAHDLDEAIALAQDFAGDLMVIGGAHVYSVAMDRADTQILTEVHRSPEGDTHYPEFDRSGWTETRREPHDGFEFVWLERSR
ncbi:MAG: diacylglycerol kinase [Marmoricola sp.]|jgi:dihydrofolate reductase|nr:diacylglycerol kinase [Marmoricola sp.]